LKTDDAPKSHHSGEIWGNTSTEFGTTASPSIVTTLLPPFKNGPALKNEKGGGRHLHIFIFCL
jgi:hypothetical protein